jgi:hypothetical protein
MDINDITYAINGAVFEVNRNQKPAAIALAQARRAGMVLDLPEGHDD